MPSNRRQPPPELADRHTPVPPPCTPADPYVVGLKMLARRELSTTQVRERLRRKGFADHESDPAIDRLQDEGALDDVRTATAFARQALNLKMRGRQRTLREIQAMGIDRGVARTAVDEVYAAVDERDLIERVLTRRLKGPISSPAEFRRLYQALLRQGFDSGTVVSILKAHTSQADQIELG